jgi:transcription elongation GreA/GreB family factor
VQGKMKKQIFKRLNEMLNQRIDAAKKAIEEVIEARDEETKSTIGDKYETGRVMVEMEMDKLKEQLEQSLALKKNLSYVKVDSVSKQVEYGSIVKTNLGTYFIAVGLGVVEVEAQKIFCISLASPIGQAIRDKKVGDKVNFQNRVIEILKVE